MCRCYTRDQLVSVMEDVRRSSYCSGVPGLEHVAVQLGIHAARVVGHEGELGINRPGGGQGDPAQGVSHEEGLHTRPCSESSKYSLSNINHSKKTSNSGSRFRPRRIFSAL